MNKSMLYLLKLVAIQSVYHPVEAPLSRPSKLSLIDLEGIAMIRLRDLRRRIQTLKITQEAAHYSQRVSPLLQGRVSIGLAEAYSDLAQENYASPIRTMWSISTENRSSSQQA
jgi:hypothetical protein